jgi:hypothetical protein
MFPIFAALLFGFGFGTALEKSNQYHKDHPKVEAPAVTTSETSK